MRTFDLRAAAVVALGSFLFLAHCRNGEDCVRESDCGDGLTCQEGECARPVTDATPPIPDASVPVPVPVPVPDASVPDAGSIDASFDDSGISDAGDADASDLDASAQDDAGDAAFADASDVDASADAAADAD